MHIDQHLWTYIPCGSREEARKIAGKAVTEKLAACGNIIPGMESVYRWKGKIEYDEEIILILKTKESRFDALKELVCSMHSYECPCVIALPIQHGNKEYLSWIDEETSSS